MLPFPNVTRSHSKMSEKNRKGKILEPAIGSVFSEIFTARDERVLSYPRTLHRHILPIIEEHRLKVHISSWIRHSLESLVTPTAIS